MARNKQEGIRKNHTENSKVLALPQRSTTRTPAELGPLFIKKIDAQFGLFLLLIQTSSLYISVLKCMAVQYIGPITGSTPGKNQFRAKTNQGKQHYTRHK